MPLSRPSAPDCLDYGDRGTGIIHTCITINTACNPAVLLGTIDRLASQGLRSAVCRTHMQTGRPSHVSAASISAIGPRVTISTPCVRAMVTRHAAADALAMGSPTTEQIASHLAALRQVIGVDVPTMAERAQLDPKIVAEIETGTRPWTLDELEALDPTAEHLYGSARVVGLSWRGQGRQGRGTSAWRAIIDPRVDGQERLPADLGPEHGVETRRSSTMHQIFMLTSIQSQC
jgi:hypothetical protein